MQGWAWSPLAAGGGRAPLLVTVAVDAVDGGTVLANITRPKLNATGAPNNEHGFSFDVAPAAAAAAHAPGRHVVHVQAHAPDGLTDVRATPVCVEAGKTVRCGAAD